LTTSLGLGLLHNYLENEGYDPDDYRLLGGGSEPVLTLLAGPGEEDQLLLRLFSDQHADLLDLEFARRNGEAGCLFPDVSAQRVNIAGLPALSIRLDGENVLSVGGVEAKPEAVAHFQVFLELASQKDFQANTVPVPFTLRQEEITENLIKASRIPGEHRQGCAELVPLVSVILEHIGRIPPGMIPSSPLRPSDLCRTKAGDVHYIGAQRWFIGRAGDCWGEGPAWGKAAENLSARHSGSDRMILNLARLNAETRVLQRALGQFKLQRVLGVIESIRSSLQTLAK
jgi:hypothetical protein